MEFVGRRVKKDFKGHGTFLGTVQSYQPDTGFFRIVYEDGDAEELEFSEVALLLVSPEQLPSPQPPDSSARKRGRRPKKRRLTDTGKTDDNSVINGDLEARGGGSSKLSLNLNEGLDLNGGGLSCLNNDDHGSNEVGDGAKLHGLDLNAGLDMELDVWIDINEEFVKETSGANKELIDLNLDVNEVFENLSAEREVGLFDLNLQLVEDDVINLDDYVGNTRAHEMVCAERDAQMRKELVQNANMGVSEDVDVDVGYVDLCKEQEEENLLKANGVDNENAVAGSARRKKRDRKRKATSNNKTEVATPEIVELDGETGTLNSEMENRERNPLKNGCHSIDCDNGNSVGSSRGRRGRRRKELSDNNITLPTSEMGLRRSSRRAKRDALSDQDHVFSTLGLHGNNFQLSSPAASFVFEEKITVSGPENYGGHILPPKVELPPSSCNLDLDGVSVFDFLSVYAFLRSFSTLLFLSPFQLDDFVASVKSNDSTSLFDSIHVSLLKTLRKHLEALSNEGSVSASKCLRSLNWDFLDLITWPIFVVEYLLLHSPGYIPGLDLCHLKLCQRDYYKLAVSAKVEIMRNLCDDVIEVDVFRSEINRRNLATEQHMDFDRNTKLESSRTRKSMMDVASPSCITEEGADEPTDWNSDECYLCKMDGNLICCDGCPAAFHPRCVGVVSSLLPEGDWYCPECEIDKDEPWMKVEKSIRGAELLGLDPYGRLYYSSCGYLLVLESCNDQYSFWFYDRNGLPPLIEALESPHFLYDTIIHAICKKWNIVREVDGTRNYLDIRSYSIKTAFPNKRQLLDIHPTTSEAQNKYKVDAEKKSDEKSIVTTYSSNIELEIAECDNVVHGTENHTVKVENRLESSEGSAEVSQAFIIDVSKEGGWDCLPICTEISPESQIPGNLANAGDHFTISPTLVTRQRKNPNSANYGNAQPSINNREIITQVRPWSKYVNCYEFARTASSVFEELISKSSVGTSAPKSVEGIIAGQLKIVSNRSAEFYWSNIHNSVKEKCGWCFYCKSPEEERDCLFIMNDSFRAVENFKSEAFGIQSGNYRKNHLIDIMCHIICIEDHLHGLLLGPWLNPHYSEFWRKCVLGVTNITSLKNLLLKVEANLNHLALSTGWRQNVDTVATMGSASHIVMRSSRVSSKHGIRRKRAKSSEPQITPSSNAMTGLTLLWWRGGRASRGLFNWKVLPRSLVSKAARQGGCKKITGILYPEVGEYAKRIKCDAWRAAVETSRSVEQLALQVRELDANIRWDDIGQNNHLSKMDKESKKSARSFKKVIIRRKCSEGTVIRYLLDFGKRRFIPDIVARHGHMLEDSSSERKKYWLEESHIPLYLLKFFEEKRIARKSNKMSSGKLRESSRVISKPLEERGFSYLFSRAERLENYQCQHCSKDVLIREAVSCQYCKGFFHKRHVQKSFGYITDDPTYTCHKCPDEEFVKSGATGGKSWLSKPTNASKQLKLVQSGKRKRLVKKGKTQVKSKKSKRAPLVITLRRSARNAERMSKLSSDNTKVKKGKKKKQANSQKGELKKLNNGCWQKKRTPVNSSYWSNGLLLSRKPDDERLAQFRNKMLLVLAGEVASNNDKPKCGLCCELEYTPNLAYVACEICGVWFHGDALDLSADKILILIGFKCHKCLNRTPPVCPYYFPPGINSTELMPENIVEIGCVEEDYKDLSLSYTRPEDLKFISNDGVYKDLSLSYTRPEDLKFISNDGVNNASLNLVLEQQSPGLMPESDRKKKDLALDEKILQRNGSVEERKQEVFDAVKIESAASVSDLVDKEAEFSPLTNNLVENSLANSKLESVANGPLSNSHELSQNQSGDTVYVGRGKHR